MNTGRTKTYNVDGTRFAFDALTFRKAFRLDAEKNGRRLKEQAEFFESELKVSTKTVNAWRGNQNAPIDIHMVKSIARLLKIDPRCLLIEVKEPPMHKLSPDQRDAVARIYAAVSDFLYMLQMTDGCVWDGYQVHPGSRYADCIAPSPEFSGEFPPRFKGEDLAFEAYSWTCHALDREWVYIGSHPIYEELAEYMDSTMLDIWNGKTDPDYRFHYSGQFDNAEDEPYEGYGAEYANWMEPVQADKKIRDIISRYL